MIYCECEVVHIMKQVVKIASVSENDRYEVNCKLNYDNVLDRYDETGSTG